MVILRLLPGLVVLMLGGPLTTSAWPSAIVLADAMQALERCAFPQAAFWARQVQKIDPEWGFLYRLAWLQQQRGLKRPEVNGSSDKLVVWPFANEIWQDERLAQLRGWECPLEPKPVVLSEVDQRLLDSEFQPVLARLDTLREATGRIVRDYIAYKWLGDELTQKSIPRILRGESTSCDFQAVMNLTNASALSPLARRCGGKTGILWSIAYSHSGDAALERKKYAGAFQEYTASVEALGPAAVPAELWYRVAVSGLAGRQADDLVFRASSQAFSKNSTIAPLFKTALYNMLCDRISDLSAPQIKHVLERVYPASEAVGEAMAIANECGPARAATLITVLLRGRPSDRNALQLYSLQLGSRQSAVAIGAATRLAQLSKSHPAQATLFFWKGVTNTPFREKAIAAYRRSGRWQPVDEARRKRWAPRSAEPEPFENLAVEQHRGKTVRIPIAFHPPAIPWKASIETDFIQTLKTGLIESSP